MWLDAPGNSSMTESHESFVRDNRSQGSSDRSFGLLFSVVFTVIGLWPITRGDRVRWWAVAIACAILVVTLSAPALLGPLNRLWFRFGLVLHAIVSRVVLGLIFFGVVTPLSLVLRRLGKDPLRLRREPSSPSYWIDRKPPGPAPDTMSRQF